MADYAVTHINVFFGAGDGAVHSVADANTSFIETISDGKATPPLRPAI